MFTSGFFRVFDPQIIPGVGTTSWIGLVYTLGIAKNSERYDFIMKKARKDGKIEIKSNRTGEIKTFVFNLKTDYDACGDKIKLEHNEYSFVPTKTCIFTHYPTRNADGLAVSVPKYHAYFHLE